MEEPPRTYELRDTVSRKEKKACTLSLLTYSLSSTKVLSSML